MKKLLFSFFILGCLSSHGQSPIEEEPVVTSLNQAAVFEKEIMDGRLARKTELALTTAILQAGKELRKRGYRYEADQMETEWFSSEQYVFRSYISKMSDRDIGDHPDQVLSKWLHDKITMLTFMLGMPVMKATHLIDLLVFNDTPKIVFRPCTFGMNSVTGSRKDEYRRNFAEGEEIYGLVPVVSFWGCVSGTISVGYTIICSPVEFLIGRFAAPRLSDIIYERVCGPNF